MAGIVQSSYLSLNLAAPDPPSLSCLHGRHCLAPRMGQGLGSGVWVHARAACSLPACLLCVADGVTGCNSEGLTEALDSYGDAPALLNTGAHLP